MLEAFFLPNSRTDLIGYESPQWKQLKENQEVRRQLLSKNAFNHYLGITQAVIDRLIKSAKAPSTASTSLSLSETAKLLSLAKLFLESARRISEGAEPMIEMLGDKSLKDLRRSITVPTTKKEGENEDHDKRNQQRLGELLQGLNGELEALVKNRKETMKKVPESPKILLNNWLIQTRKELHWLNNS